MQFLITFLIANYNYFFLWKSDLTIKKLILDGNEKKVVRENKLKFFYLNFIKNKK